MPSSGRPVTRRGRVEGTPRGRWGKGTQALLVISVTAVLWFLRWAVSSPGQGWDELALWMDDRGLGRYKLLFKKIGVTHIHQFCELDVSNHQQLGLLDANTQILLQGAARSLQDELVFESWLLDHNLHSYKERFQEQKVSSLLDLAQAPEFVLQKVTANDKSLKDYGRLKNRIIALRDPDNDLDLLQSTHWVRVKGGALQVTKKSGKASWVSSVCFGVAVAAMTAYCVRHRGPGAITSSKHSLFEFVTGKYLATQYSRVSWDWTEPQTVGKTVTFKIKFFQRNGRSYPISTGDNLLVEIMHGSTKIPPTIQYGVSVNTVSVAFTVHRAGEYKISILVGAKHIKGSPFVKKFLAGPLDPTKTGFVGQSSVVVCTQSLRHSLILEPRDEYGNISTYDPENDSPSNYKLNITEAGSHRQFSPDLQVTYEKSTKRVVLSMRLDDEGCYQASATYKGISLKNGQFTVLVLSEKDAGAVRKAVVKKSTNVFYEARLLSTNYDKHSKAKKVFCYISPKQLTVKEFYLKVIPKRLFTFRVCPSTKFQFGGYNNQYDLPTFVIEDGCQPPVELAAKDRNIIAATFTNFLLKNIGGSETFKDKQDFFYHEVRQIHHKRLHEKLAIKINRTNLLESSMKATKNFSTSDWCKNFEICFQGEEALDWGGVRREWFELVCMELYDPAAAGLFQRFKDDNQGLVHPNPCKGQKKFFEFAGRIVGKCLYESALGGSYRQLVKARFTRSFLAQLIGLRVNYKYFEQDDPDLYVTKVRFIEENDVEDMDMVFSEEEYKDGKLEKLIDLVPNGSKVAVTNQNKLRYLDALAQYRLANSVRDEIESFLKGLNELIPDNLLSIFDEGELELLMCGTSNYSIAEFKEHHIISGTSPEFQKVLDWFWTVISGFTREEMGRLLQFTTGCSQLPPGGFAELVPKFQITAAPTYGNLPTAHTCFNQLCLPDYDSLDQFHQALVTALNEGNQGFGMI